MKRIRNSDFPRCTLNGIENCSASLERDENCSASLERDFQKIASQHQYLKLKETTTLLYMVYIG